MKILSLGHLVLKVANLDRAIAFYGGVLGLPLVARRAIRGTPMAFFSLGGNHHDLALAQIGTAASAPSEYATGLAHFALKIGDSLSALREARDHLTAHGIAIDRTVDHRVSQSLYVRDSDGHIVELYVDADPAIWGEDPSAVAYSEPMTL